MASNENPHRRIRSQLRNGALFGVLALAALIAGHQFEASALTVRHPVVWACGALVLVFGVLATRETAVGVGRLVSGRAGRGGAAPLRVVIQVVGYTLTVLGVLDAVNVSLTHLLTGGAITGIVLGIAAQQSLASFFAGLVLQLTRPYVVGDHITVYAGAVNGPHEGVVTDIRLVYTTVRTAKEELQLPNSVMLSAGIASGRSGFEGGRGAPVDPEAGAGRGAGTGRDVGGPPGTVDTAEGVVAAGSVVGAEPGVGTASGDGRVDRPASDLAD